jgi:hypothetical protein
MKRSGNIAILFLLTITIIPICVLYAEKCFLDEETTLDILLKKCKK